jgi:hypothetical protein
MTDESTPSDLPPAFVPYDVSGIGTVTAHEGDTYVVAALNGSTYGYTSPSGTPDEAHAANEIAYAIANPPAYVEPVPASVTRRQLFLYLLSLGVTRAMIRAQLAGNEAALIELEEASEFLRENPLVNSLAAALGIDADTAFRAASLL